MSSDTLKVADGVSAGAWIEPELTGEWGSVTGVVPDRFESYVRILHPVGDKEGEPVSWEHVAATMGRTTHPLVQWDALVAANRYRNEASQWPGSEPPTGALDLSLLEALCGVLTDHTEEAARCFFAIWTGQSFGSFVAVGEGTPKLESPKQEPWRSTRDLCYAFPADELTQPLLELPPMAGREYRVLTGPLSAAIQIPGRIDPKSQSITPNMIWPNDQAWFVASEIDFDSTLVGGSADLAKAILDTPEFEAWPVNPGDSLAWDADKLNPLPPHDDYSEQVRESGDLD